MVPQSVLRLTIYHALGLGPANLARAVFQACHGIVHCSVHSAFTFPGWTRGRSPKVELLLAAQQNRMPAQLVPVGLPVAIEDYRNMSLQLLRQ